MQLAFRITLLLIGTIALVSCGSSQRPAAHLKQNTKPSIEQPKIACKIPEFTGNMSVQDARRLLDQSIARAGRTDRIFTTQIKVQDHTRRSEGMLTGHRRADDGTSQGTLRWTTREIPLPQGVILIKDNELSLAKDAKSPQLKLGSASGVSLDVGRELLAHPFLVDTRTASGTKRSFTITMVAPQARLRSYATHERSGPVSTLLEQAQSLHITAHVRDGNLVADHFTLKLTGSLSAVTQVDGTTCASYPASTPEASA